MIHKLIYDFGNGNFRSSKTVRRQNNRLQVLEEDKNNADDIDISTALMTEKWPKTFPWENIGHARREK